MKFKRLLAATAVATVASTTVMAEGVYIGTEINKNSISSDRFIITESTDFYVGSEIELTDSLTLDTRIEYAMVDKPDSDFFRYSAELTKEYDGLEIYGELSYIKGDFNTKGTAYTLGMRYNF